MWLTCVFLAAALAPADLPRVDLHAHIHDEENAANSIIPADALALSQKLGVKLGVLAEGGCAGEVRDERTLSEFLKSMEGIPLYRGLQVYGFNWPKCLPAEGRAKLDYISADALIFPDRGGRSVWLWLPGVKFDDPQDFMQRYVDFNVQVLSQPIQIWTNPTYLPETLQARYDELWTAERMRRVIDAAVKNGIAIELNTKFRIPSAGFVRMAKEAGAKFTFGSNGHGKSGTGDISYGLKVARECGLTGEDFWLPKKRNSR